jgi:uncharacterized protein (DUF488 family)
VPQLLTIGHSNHDADHFAALLADARIEVLADVRSWPMSRHAEWADGDSLPAWLRERGHRHVFLGKELGGRPDAPDCYDVAGHVLYGRVARLPHFEAGLRRLRQGIDSYRVAVMCSEEDPTDCHRRLLVAKVLMDQGVEVLHVRGDGRVEREHGIAPDAAKLFDDEDLWWRSTRSVSRRRRLSGSSPA